MPQSIGRRCARDKEAASRRERTHEHTNECFSPCHSLSLCWESSTKRAASCLCAEGFGQAADARQGRQGALLDAGVEAVGTRCFHGKHRDVIPTNLKVAMLCMCVCVCVCVSFVWGGTLFFGVVGLLCCWVLGFLDS